MRFVAIVPRKLLVSVQSVTKQTRRLKKLPWAMYTYAHMVVEGVSIMLLI